MNDKNSAPRRVRGITRRRFLEGVGLGAAALAVGSRALGRAADVLAAPLPPRTYQAAFDYRGWLVMSCLRFHRTGSPSRSSSTTLEPAITYPSDPEGALPARRRIGDPRSIMRIHSLQTAELT